MATNSSTTTGTDSNKKNSKITCPYLDTINRTSLDFDFEPTCSITLSSGPHIYGCLVCGKFFRGKGRRTPAYLHSINENHNVFIHLNQHQQKKQKPKEKTTVAAAPATADDNDNDNDNNSGVTFWCLPDDYEIIDSSLDDIKNAYRPIYTPSDIRSLDDQTSLSRDLFGKRYLPGYVGLNNLNKTDFINVALQALVHVRPLRDFFLRCGKGDVFDVTIRVPRKTKNSTSTSTATTTKSKLAPKKRKRGVEEATSKGHVSFKKKTITIDPNNFSHLVKTFGEMVRKMWSNRRFKSTVDPHLFVQAVSTASNKKFTIGKQADVSEFIRWLIHQLHVGLIAGSSSSSTGAGGSSIIHEIFQGVVEITTRRQKRGEHGNSGQTVEEEDNRYGSEDEEEVRAREEEKRRLEIEFANSIEEISHSTNFLQLTLDIPEKPLFKDETNGGLVIPQEPLVNILKKFDGISFSDVLSNNGNIGGTDRHQQHQHQKRRYRLKYLPNHLILCLSRFKRNSFTNEKNPTIVPFPVKNLDLGPYIFNACDANVDNSGGTNKHKPTEDEIRSMNIKKLKGLLHKENQSKLALNIVEKEELIRVCIDYFNSKTYDSSSSLSNVLLNKYDLVANITHTINAEVGREGQFDPLEEGEYRCHIQHKSTSQWYEAQDLRVREIMPQLIGLSESFVLIFERKFN